jgi:hypothetical protein
MPTKPRIPRKKKEKIPPEPYWYAAFVCASEFMVSKFGDLGADGIKRSLRDLKSILRNLRENAEGRGSIWNEETAYRTLSYFLNFAWSLEIPELPFPKTSDFFITFCNKYKESIIEHIKLLKNAKR